MNQDRIFCWLQQTYAQCTEAETHDLALGLSRLFDKLFTDRIHELVGYVENGTDTILKVYQDDATRTFHVHVGKREYWDSSLVLALNKALLDVRDEGALI